MDRTVAIDCFPDSVAAYYDHTVVAVDVFRATTTAVTAVARGRRCFPVGTIEEAVPVAARLSHPLLVGELGGNVPYGFDVNNSPAQVELRSDIERPMILLSTSGTRLICEAGRAQGAYVASLRNVSALVPWLAGRHDRVAVIGAGARGEFREEDQVCCAWIAEGLMASGFQARNDNTARLVERWSGASLDPLRAGHSAQYLRDTGQLDDLDFVLAHVDDIDAVFPYQAGEVTMIRAVELAAP